jgi:dTDP-glucose 4,6-dehydratase
MKTKLFKPKNILITGGAGFIGANFIRYYSKSRPEVRLINLDKLTYAANNDNLKDIYDQNRFEFIHGDICDYDLILKLLRNYKIDAIINFAAESHVDRSINEPLLFAKTNVLGTASLLEAARVYWLTELHLQDDECRFYQISTDEVFGSLSSNDRPSAEDHLYQPSSPYSASKAGADHFVHAYHHTYGLPVVLSHCSNNYGPCQHNEKFIPTIINACLKWQTIPIYGNGNNVRDWIYVEDHCTAIHSILENGFLGQSYNIGANNQISNTNLAKEICILMDSLYSQEKSYSSLISYVPDRLGHDLRYALDTCKINKELNWAAQTNLQSGLMKTIEYFTIIHKDIYESIHVPST